MRPLSRQKQLHYFHKCAFRRSHVDNIFVERTFRRNVGSLVSPRLKGQFLIKKIVVIPLVKLLSQLVCLEY